MRSMEELARLKHFIWDFDGTLFDTYPVIIRNLRDALAEFGFDAEPVDMMRRMLETIPAARNHYADTYGIDREVLRDAYEKYHQVANAEMVAQPMEGVRELLQRIRDRGGYHYIFTNRKVSETEAYLEKYGLTDQFRMVVGPETPGFAWKPAPDAIDLLVEKFGMDRAEAVMVGDRECDLGSGRNAGIRTLHYVCKVAPEDLNCDWRAENFTEVLNCLSDR